MIKASLNHHFPVDRIAKIGFYFSRPNYF